jgi:hypothetical protein
MKKTVSERIKTHTQKKLRTKLICTLRIRAATKKISIYSSIYTRQANAYCLATADQLKKTEFNIYFH